MKAILLLYILTAFLLYYLSTNIFVVILYISSTVLAERIMNMLVSNKMMKKAKKDINKTSL